MVVGGLTKVRSLFKLRNTSCFLIDLRSAISSRSNKACSMPSATYPTLPYWKSLMDALASRAASSNTKAGVQVGTPTLESPFLSIKVCATLDCLAPF